jgi:cytochrome c oxidase subunit 2
MQMKIIVDTPEDYKVWLKEQTNLVTQVKALLLLSSCEGVMGNDSLKAKDTAAVSKIAMK